MLRGLQTSMQAMKVQLATQEVLGKNLLNMSTQGYKQEAVPTSGFGSAIARLRAGEARPQLLSTAQALPLGSLSTGVGIEEVFVDFSQGHLDQTGRPLDVALQGDGFLQLRTPEGDCYFRGGELQVDRDGRLVDAHGYSVLGTEGEVMLDGSVDSIESDGTILVDGQAVGRLSVVEFPPGTRLAKLGEGLYAPENPLEAGSAGSTIVRGGYLEGSNVDQASNMGQMVSLLRAYQANQRILQAQDELAGKAINEIGKV